ncbi:MBL fold metallo-hydrolase [Marinobacter sp. bablab_jr008]|uniref:MBL fold metallo-hydrolase n=1 Tax=Marinobacter sp. bablab_jr008 TaxID=2755064 RepID=UPI002B1BD1C4|nr:MBL fold metallo-hydrolase [Marinobacter sp. bablab_jr008]MEC7432404.1 MBL fold metallo-hydrolase [Pseudomonadota bacterium]MEC8898777.1 MBL fold metallo-hydrolase [Pseudomonadota bacterium]MEC9040760.1 MBL fold metallo-hydrolase [Pseudomonadota bacterium]MEC9385793.1 MBL fold metallo-hydrolase [Pseudomonadota bacterium]
MSLKYKIVPVTPFEQNCTLLWCTETHKAAVVDPGGDLDRILAAAEDEGVILEKILLTHAHIDHAGGTAELAKSAELPIEGPHKDDNFWIQGLAMQAQMFGFPAPEVFTPNRWLEDGDTVTVGNETLEVLHTPGHTPGHVVFFHRGSKLAQVGDVLFNGSIGRTDFPKGDYNTLIHSIREKLFPLGDDVSFICGHGPMSTFGQERATNPFVSDHRG